MESRHPPLPTALASWFAGRGWAPRPHQLAMAAAAAAGRDALLIAPTGAGKTLAGFLPTLIDACAGPSDALTTLYVSPLKALAVDIARNLETPVRDVGLPLRIETRTGDTPSAKKARQRAAPPNVLLTTPESLSLLISYPDADKMLAGLRTVIIDEIHAFAPTKRGDLLALALTRLEGLAPELRRVGLSATLADETAGARWLGPDTLIVRGEAGARPHIEILLPDGRIPWGGHAARHAVPAVYDLVRQHRTTLIFTNTRAIAERIFADLWSLNAENLAIGLHHGSLAMEQRRKVESAMAAGKLRGIVATASLDLGLDWGEIDLVVQMGAPKGSARLLQRIGRANHRLDDPSKAILVPGNRFEYLEAIAALDAVSEGAVDGEPFRPGALDVLAQHLVALGCAAPFSADAVFAEVTRAAPYATLSRQDFDDALNFAVSGGYALRAYDRFQRLHRRADGLYAVGHPRTAQQHRLNAGTIVESAMLTVRFRRGASLGKVEEYFAEQLSPGDRFRFAGRTLAFVGIDGTDVLVQPSEGDPQIPSYAGGRLPLSTHLAARVRALLATPAEWPRFPPPVREWLDLQQRVSVLPDPDGLLVETFPRQDRHYLSAYCFEGRNAHQTLGLLITRRMEELGLAPLGFVANDYVISVWSLRPVTDPAPLFAPTILEAEFRHWMAESSVLRKSFRDVSIISGLIERQVPGQRKTGRQVTFSADLIYDVLRKYDPDHLLLRATWADARGKITDLDRLGSFLERIQGRIRHQVLAKVSPLAVPALLEIGREQVYGNADDELLGEAAALIAEASGG
jgi:ATP-dependent helicase Lhr and Lhr-like helicase